MKSLIRIGAVLAMAAPLMIGISTPANASTISQCTDKYQVGSTVYIGDVAGGTAASVKQYWSPMCAQNFAYVYVWQSFRDTHTSWTVDVTEQYADSTYTVYNEGEVITYNSRGSDFWSHGFSGAGKCTSALATLSWTSGGYDYIVNNSTDFRCG